MMSFTTIFFVKVLQKKEKKRKEGGIEKILNF